MLDCVLVVGAAEVTAVAQAPATLAALLAVPDTSRGTINATPTPTTSATTPTTATSLRRDRPEPQLSG